MDHLPTEIKRMIAFHLLSDDSADGGIIHIKQLRLVNKDYAIVAAEPLFSEIYPMLKSESFERMRKVSAHPSYAKLLRSLRYEPDCLKDYGDHVDWVRLDHLAKPYLPNISWPAWPRQDESEQEWITFRMVCQEYIARFAAVAQSLRPRYDIYRTAFQDQEAIRQPMNNRGLFTEAMARMPNLEQVILNLAYGIMEQMKALKTSSPVTDGLARTEPDGSPHGVMQLRTILLAAHDTDTKLKVLRCGYVDLRFILLPKVDMDSMKSALSHLTTLHISIYAGCKYACCKSHIPEQS